MLSIYDSLTRETRPFVPLVPGQIGIYVCGQTVYDAPHLGHARKDLGFDVVCAGSRRRATRSPTFAT